ncbi:MAG: hypothetical protein OXI17_12275 [Gammaproteobacteria bacterium]|nr:hypothetical protein [Gammaproteobacteria bacterium]MDE0509392.1 hypothetical protein [Gammaproteobacteria bacterium]
MAIVPENINKIANKIATQLEAKVVIYSGAIDGLGYGKLIRAIRSTDAQPSMKNTLLLLTTHGGSAQYAYKIARLLQDLTPDKFYLCLPSTCKSAGTLVALGANELFMSVVSELGPLDVQLQQRDEIGKRRSGMVVRTALDGLANETYQVFERVMLGIKKSSEQNVSFEVASKIASAIATGMMAPVYAQINPEALGNDLRDLSVARAYGNRLAKLGGNATQETVRKFIEDYPAHEFIIDEMESKGLFNIVNRETAEISELESELGSIVYTVQDPHYIERVDGNFKKEGNGKGKKKKKGEG